VRIQGREKMRSAYAERGLRLLGRKQSRKAVQRQKEEERGDRDDRRADKKGRCRRRGVWKEGRE